MFTQAEDSSKSGLDASEPAEDFGNEEIRHNFLPISPAGPQATNPEGKPNTHGNFTGQQENILRRSTRTRSKVSHFRRLIPEPREFHHEGFYTIGTGLEILHKGRVNLVTHFTTTHWALGSSYTFVSASEVSPHRPSAISEAADFPQEACSAEDAAFSHAGVLEFSSSRLSRPSPKPQNQQGPGDNFVPINRG
jgi:hypothetical protein